MLGAIYKKNVNQWVYIFLNQLNSSFGLKNILLGYGSNKSFNIHFIDFETPTNNVFHITEEFTVLRKKTSEKVKTRPPDLVLFINGIPFGVIELKKASVDTKKGILQMIKNQQKHEIPELFKYIQITLAGNNTDPKYGTVGTPEKFYSIWKEELELEEMKKLVTDRVPSKLDEMVYGLFLPERVPLLIRNYIVFAIPMPKLTGQATSFLR